MDTHKADERRTRQKEHRQKLLEAIIEYIFEHGLSSLSIRPLAKALGISHRTLLYHFGTKEQLIVAVLHEMRERERAFLLSLVQKQEPTELVTLGWAFWRRSTTPAYERYLRLFFEIYGLALQSPEIYGEFLNEVITSWLPLYEQTLKNEGYAASHATNIATLVLAVVRGLQLDLLTTHDQKRIDAALEYLGYLLERRTTLDPGE